MEIEELYRLYRGQNQSITTDTRKLDKGSIFFALKGDNFDANQFAVKAIEAGCAYAVVDDSSIVHPKCIVVKNVLQTLQNLATYHRQQFTIPIIAITGTNGKTTTKELMKEVLATKYKVHFTKGNLNNHIGVPLTLLSMSTDTEIAIIEMGANHPLEIDFLCNIALPNYGLVTNMGKAHLEGFGGFEGVVKTKSEMYDFHAQKEGKVFVNASDELLMKQSSKVKNRIFYQNENISGEVKLSNPCVVANMKIHSQEIEVKSNLFGEHNLINMLAAAAVGIEFGVSVGDIKLALEGYLPENNRSQIKKTEKGNTLILDAYNANPTSMAAALRAFAKSEGGNKIALVGDMLELGSESLTEHQEIVKLIEILGIEAILVGKEFSRCKTSFKVFLDSSSLKSFLAENSWRNKVILIKGSRGIKLEIVQDLL